MRNLFYILFFVVALSLFACEDREPEPIIVPEWIKPQLIELENSGDCIGCRVQRWTYKEEYIYHLYCDNESCIDCGFFHNDGTSVEWGVTIDHADFDANKTRPILVWECGDELDL